MNVLNRTDPSGLLRLARITRSHAFSSCDFFQLNAEGAEGPQRSRRIFPRRPPRNLGALRVFLSDSGGRPDAMLAIVLEGCGPMSRPRFAYLLLLVAPVFFASNMLVARWAAGAIPPVGMAFWRWTLTFCLLQ